MKLRAKINSKYLDEIVSGSKKFEYRQFESMILTDENGRVLEFDIENVGPAGLQQEIRNRYPDIPWTNKIIYAIKLGKQIETTK